MKFKFLFTIGLIILSGIHLVSTASSMWGVVPVILMATSAFYLGYLLFIGKPGSIFDALKRDREYELAGSSVINDQGRGAHILLLYLPNQTSEQTRVLTYRTSVEDAERMKHLIDNAYASFLYWKKEAAGKCLFVRIVEIECPALGRGVCSCGSSHALPIAA